MRIDLRVFFCSSRCFSTFIYLAASANSSELPNQAGRDAKEVVGQTRWPIRDQMGSWAFEGEIGILVAPVDAESEAPREWNVQAAAKDRCKGGGRCDCIVRSPVLVHAGLSCQSLHKYCLSFKSNVVLTAPKKIERLLRRTQVRPPVSRDVEFKTQVFPGREGQLNIPAIQRLTGSRQAVQGIREKRVAAVKLVECVVV